MKVKGKKKVYEGWEHYNKESYPIFSHQSEDSLTFFIHQERKKKSKKIRITVEEL